MFYVDRNRDLLRLAFAVVSSASVLMALGCSDLHIGQVSGTVTLDGEPLAEANIEFAPQSGAPSYGVTDSKGQYVLSYSPQVKGAEVGTHTVRISTYYVEARANGVKRPERVPASFNASSDVTREVKRGRQVFDFDILTTPK